MSKEKQCECCHEWWFDTDIKEDLCPNCYYYFKQLKQQLAEKQNEIDEINKEFVQTVHDWKILLKEKDKEIASLQVLIIENKNDIKEMREFKIGDYEYDLTDEDARNDIKNQLENQTQLAIQELEKFRAKLVNRFNPVVLSYTEYAQKLFEELNQQIKELKGEKNDNY